MKIVLSIWWLSILVMGGVISFWYLPLLAIVDVILYFCPLGARMLYEEQRFKKMWILQIYLNQLVYRLVLRRKVFRMVIWQYKRDWSTKSIK